MSLFKLAIYGGIGYLVYQTFFADMPEPGTQRGADSSSGRENPQQRGRRARRADGRFSGGTVAKTEDPTGASTTHHVGRGVIS